MAIDRDEQIRRRAYEIWESEGCPEGAELRHWQQASDEVEWGGSSTAGGERDEAALLQGAGKSGDFDRPGEKPAKRKKVAKGEHAPVSTEPKGKIRTAEPPSIPKIKKTERL